MYSEVDTHTRIRQGSVVSLPKTSRLTKFPQRPTACPMSRPMTPRSAKAPKEIPFFLQKTSSTKNATITAP